MKNKRHLRLRGSERLLALTLGVSALGLIGAKTYLGEQDALVGALSGDAVVVAALLIVFGTRSFFLFLAPGLILFAFVARRFLEEPKRRTERGEDFTGPSGSMRE